MRVLVLITKLDRGGAETFSMNYLRHFIREDVQYDFLVNRQDPGAYEEEAKSLGSRIYRMSPMYPQFFQRYKREFRQFLIQHPEYQIIHSNLEERSYFPLRIAKQLGVPVRIAHAHNEYKSFNLKTPVRDYFRFRLPPYVTHEFACSVDAGNWLFGKRELTSTKFHLIRNAIDLKEYTYKPKIRQSVRLRIGVNDRLVVGHVGRLTKQKNQMFLLDVFSEIKKMRRDAILILVGSGEQKESLQSKVKQLNIDDSVRFIGSVPNVTDYLQAMDVFIFPSLYEGLPISLIEAQAVGLPILASDSVSQEVAITSNVHFASLHKSAKQWAEQAIRTACEARKDGTQKVREAGYDIRKQAPKLQQFYVNALESEEARNDKHGRI